MITRAAPSERVIKDAADTATKADWQAQLAREPLSVEAWLGLAQSAKSRGDVDRALQFVQIAAIGAGADDALNLAIGRSAIRFGAGNLALTALARIRSSSAFAAEARRTLAALHIDLRQFEWAAKEAQQSLADGPAAALLLAEAHVRQGDARRARSVLNAQLARTSDAEEVEAALVRLDLQQKGVDLRTYVVSDSLIARRPSLTHELAAARAEAEDDASAALAHYHAAATAAESDGHLWRKTATFALKAHDLATAALAAERVLAIAPCDPEAYLTLASTARTVVDDWRAAQALDRYLSNNPFDRLVATSLFSILSRRGAYEKVLEISERMPQAQMRAQSFVIDIAEALSATGDLPRAVDLVRELPTAQKPPSAAVMLLRVARASRSLPSSDLAHLLLGLWPSKEVGQAVFDLLRRQRDVAAAVGWAEALVSAFGGAGPLPWRNYVAVAETAGRLDLVEAWSAAGRLNRIVAATPDVTKQPLTSKSAVAEYRKHLAKTAAERPAPDLFLSAAERLLSFGHMAAARNEVTAGLRRFPEDRRLLAASVHLLLLDDDQDQAIRVLSLITDGPTTSQIDPSPVLQGALAWTMRRGNIGAAERLVADVLRFCQRLVANAQTGHPAFPELLSFVARHGEAGDVLGLARATAEQADLSVAALSALAHALSIAGDPADALSAGLRAVAAGVSPEGATRLAALSRESGYPAEVIDGLRRAVASQPKSLVLLDALVDALERSGRVEEAVAVGGLAFAAAGSTAGRAALLARQQLRLGRLPAFIEHLNTVVADFSNDREGHVLLAAALIENGELRAADERLNAVAWRLGHSIDSLELHVQVRYLRMDYAGAEAVLAATALERFGTPQMLRRLGWLHRRLTHTEEALRLARAAAGSPEGDYTAQLHIVELLQDGGRLDEARAVVETLIAEHPLRERLHQMLGWLQQLMGDREAARESFRRALLLNRFDVAALTQLGLIEEGFCDFTAALAHHTASLAISERNQQPPALRTLWHGVLNAMMLGDLETAIRLHERLCAAFDETLANMGPTWRGERLDTGTLVVAMRGGPGDEFRIATMALPWLLSQRAGRIRFACDPRCHSLLARTLPEVEFIPTPSGHRQLRRKGAATHRLHDTLWPGVTARITDMAIPFGHVGEGDHVTSSDTLVHYAFFENVLRDGGALEHRFLRPDPARSAEMRRFLDGLGAGLKVGVCWRGSYRSSYRDRIFLEIDELAPLFDLSGVRFVDLQMNKDAYEQSVAAAAGVVSVPELDLYDDFEGMAALMSELDLIVTPGMTMRDLAGALNVPVYSFLATAGASDHWRKQPDDTDCWQPSIRHFDVMAAGSRTEMVLAVRDAVAARAMGTDVSAAA